MLTLVSESIQEAPRCKDVPLSVGRARSNLRPAFEKLSTRASPRRGLLGQSHHGVPGEGGGQPARLEPFASAANCGGCTMCIARAQAARSPPSDPNLQHMYADRDRGEVLVEEAILNTGRHPARLFRSSGWVRVLL